MKKLGMAGCLLVCFSSGLFAKTFLRVKGEVVEALWVYGDEEIFHIKDKDAVEEQQVFRTKDGAVTLLVQKNAIFSLNMIKIDTSKKGMETDISSSLDNLFAKAVLTPEDSEAFFKALDLKGAGEEAEVLEKFFQTSDGGAKIACMREGPNLPVTCVVKVRKMD